jgi:hypothetical protein
MQEVLCKNAQIVYECLIYVMISANINCIWANAYYVILTTNNAKSPLRIIIVHS